MKFTAVLLIVPFLLLLTPAAPAQQAEISADRVVLEITGMT